MAMDGTETDSMCHVKASDLYPKRELLCDECELVVPFTPVCGEAVEYLGRDVDVVIALSNYRFYLQLKDTYYNIPLGLIDLLEVKDIFFLHIFCKDARSLRCSFSTNEYCLEWLGRLNKATSPPKNIESLFAFSYYVWSIEDGGEELCNRLGKDNSLSLNEVERLKFDLLGAWRISRANSEYKLCPSYPKQLLVPACITDETLESVARFRSARRIPAVVW
ncbi:unnamed protein product, partial [Timema podura]|nr:unnamed protein product [Timema podura]